MKTLFRRLLRATVSARTLNRVNALSHLEDRLLELELRCARLARAAAQTRYPTLFAKPRPGYEFALFSQNGEDGILLHLLAQIGDTPKRAVEIGIGDGRECNSALLAHVLEWDCLLVDANPLGVATARRLAQLATRELSNQVEVLQHWVTPENVSVLLRQKGFGESLGVLSIDVDGVDYWIWKALGPIADLVVVEYNASLGPDRSITVPSQADFDGRRLHPGGYYGGASLAALVKLGQSLGYSLAAVDSRGVNAFFVRDAIRPPAIAASSAHDLFRPHELRLRRHSQQEQWDQVSHLPFVEV